MGVGRPQPGPVAVRPARRPLAPASPPSAGRTRRASTAPGSPRGSPTSSRPGRSRHGTWPAGSPCPSCRANARTCQRTPAPTSSPTTLPASRPFAPLQTTSRHSTPHTPTGQHKNAPDRPFSSAFSGAGAARRRAQPQGEKASGRTRRRRDEAEERQVGGGGVERETRSRAGGASAYRTISHRRPARQAVEERVDRGRRPRPLAPATDAPAAGGTSPSSPAAASAAAVPIAGRSTSSTASTSTSRRGSQCPYAPPWTSAPCRLRHWARPTTFFPSAPTVTSPGPTPAKQIRGDQRAGIDRPRWTASSSGADPGGGGDGRPPPLPRPERRDEHVVVPERITPGHPDVDPDRVVRGDMDRAAAAPPPRHRHPGRRRPSRVDDRRRLAAAEDDRLPVDRPDDDDPAGRRPEPIDVEPIAVGRAGVRSAEPAVRKPRPGTAPRAGRPRPGDGAARGTRPAPTA